MPNIFIIDDIERLETDVRTYLWKAQRELSDMKSYERQRYTKGRISAYSTVLKRLQRILDRKPSATASVHSLRE